jgi:hypothetical protein
MQISILEELPHGTLKLADKRLNWIMAVFFQKPTGINIHTRMMGCVSIILKEE